jgi:uncharacterized protein YbaP (TraB family)
MKRLAAALAAFLALAVAAPAAADPPVWRIRKDGAEVTLFGSVHLLNPGQPWETPAVRRDLEQAGSVWFEIPLDPEARAAAGPLAAAKSLLPAGQTLSQRLSPKGRERLARAAAKVGLSAQAFAPMRPWFAETSLTILHLQARGATQGDGVEETLSGQAPAGAQRKAFETMEQQIGWLAGASDKEQVASLEETLRQIDEDPQAFDRLQKAWVDGDVAAIVREGVEPLREITPGLYQQLVVERNRRWTLEIERLLKTKERAFIVVGVGHLVGPDSVPAMLRRRGVAVEGP